MLNSLEEFAAAAREYIALVTTIKKVSSAMSQLRQEQKRLGAIVYCGMLEAQKREMICSDLSTLKLVSTTRRETLGRDHIIIEFQGHMSLQQAEAAWENIQARRPIIEKDELVYSTTEKRDKNFLSVPK